MGGLVQRKCVKFMSLLALPVQTSVAIAILFGIPHKIF